LPGPQVDEPPRILVPIRREAAELQDAGRLQRALGIAQRRVHLDHDVEIDVVRERCRTALQRTATNSLSELRGAAARCEPHPGRRARRRADDDIFFAHLEAVPE
jgi:hypothetical protein